MKDYYKILGLTKDTSTEKIKQKFKELALEYHPDVSLYENSNEIFLEINEAYEILADPNKKIMYDTLYEKYFTRKMNDVQNEEHIKTNIQNFAITARKTAEQNSKIKYQDYIKDLDCFFSSGQKANGSAFNYYMHKTTGIIGGVGPRGSINAKSLCISIPRSKKAKNLHKIGFVIKVIFLLFALIALRFNLLSFSGFVQKMAFTASFLITGGLIVHLIYYLTKTKSRFFHARSFYLVSKCKKKGFLRGFHPMISTTPIGIIIYIFRWIL